MKHNSYFEGKVQSLAVGTAGGPATVGVIVTSSRPRMEPFPESVRATAA